MELKVGDRIKLLPTTFYDDCQNNPHWGGRYGNVGGIIIDGDLGFEVNWDNGKTNNCYKEGKDLQLLSESEDTKTAIKFSNFLK